MVYVVRTPAYSIDCNQSIRHLASQIHVASMWQKYHQIIQPSARKSVGGGRSITSEKGGRRQRRRSLLKAELNRILKLETLRNLRKPVGTPP